MGMKCGKKGQVMERFDIAIIGTGPAGLEAAITAKIRNKKIILFGDKQLSLKVEKAHTIQNYLGLPGVSGEALKDAYLDHLKTLEIEITEDRINTVYAMGEYFFLQGNGTNYEASSIILATGVSNVKPITGEEAFLGKGVSYCATCDALLYRDKTVAIVGYAPKAEAEADFMTEVAQKVYYIPMYKEEVHVSEKVCLLKEMPKAVEGTFKVEKLITEQNCYELDGVFFLRENIAPAQLVPGLKIEENHIAVDRRMRTNLNGCFACGDIVGEPYQYIKSAGEGNVAALSAVAYLAEKKRNKEKE